MIHLISKTWTCLEQAPLFQIVNTVNFSPALIQILVIRRTTLKQQGI